jgi:Fe-S cluster assembly iron-binding protein IscA
MERTSYEKKMKRYRILYGTELRYPDQELYQFLKFKNSNHKEVTNNKNGRSISI